MARISLDKQPAHLSIYTALRNMILSGDLAPGQAVTIQGLCELLGGSTTPVREAIRRLTSERALHFQGNRRVSVPVLTLPQIDELTFARVALEPELARRALKNMTSELIDELAQIDAQVDLAIELGDVKSYLQTNHRFHMTLYDAAHSDILLPAVNSFWLRSSPSLRVICGRKGTQHLPDKHQETIAALRAGDGEAVARAIGQDIRQGMDNIRAALLETRAQDGEVTRKVS
ncbi:GntR family transcriptional regulator [Thioclava dalianensis]|uniref:GntR family transcriptional regulator n=1 Tax=Thioclava dalianensis TaxID=1185766 RepID=A0A074U9Q2_9RHOB|nr:GntR family transcriptional regulator [Thioclava dalianensis]SFM79429.1 DNA-binding transcriptional regulator, GntR family [Thioclava dalianensis]